MNNTNTNTRSPDDSSKRELRKLLYCIVGFLLLLAALDFSFGGVFSVMALSKFEIIFLFGMYFVSKNNTELDRKVNIDWFSSSKNEVNIGWIHSKVTDLSWIGVVPFYLCLFLLLAYFLDKSKSDQQAAIDGLFNQTTFSALLLIYVTSVLIMRNAYLRFQLSRMKSKSVRESEPVEVTSESTEKEEVSNG